MKPPRPLFVILSGFILVFAGLAYDITFAGVPVQNPSPRLQTSFEAHKTFATRLTGIGVFVTFIGIAAAIIRFARRRKSHQAAPARSEIRST